MYILLAIGMILLSYMLGSVPFGLLMVKITTGKDIRQVASGRTGGTNAARAAGVWVGLATALLDGLKGAAAAWIAQAALPYGAHPINAWIHVCAPLAAILGHNYPIYLAHRDEKGRIRLSGGAGGAPCVGGAAGLWLPNLLIILPVGAGVLFGVGYASLATLSAGLMTILVFGVRAYLGLSPWQYIFYGVAALILLGWSLRPNIKRLIQGQERLIGWRAKRQHSS